MSLYRRGYLRRPRCIYLPLFLLTILTVQSQSRDIRPSEHGLANDKDSGAISPAMAAFFGGENGAVPPEAKNTTAPAWRLAGREAPADPQHGSRTILLVAGVACGAVGVGFLGAAAVAYVVHGRRSKPGSGVGLGLDLGRRKTGPEVRLGAA